MGWVDAQERHGTTVPYENEIFVNNWRAWRIREYTIKKILKNRWDEIFLILFIAYRGAPGFRIILFLLTPRHGFNYHV